MQAVNGEEQTKIFLKNNNDCYILPNGLGYVAKVIDDTLLETDDKTMLKVGRSTIINSKCLSDIIGTNTIRLVADVDGQTIETDVPGLSAAACTKLAKTKGLSKAQQRDYQHRHFEPGYRITSSGGGSGYFGFLIKEYEPCERPESYYDIDDDEIMFLGV